MLFVEEFCILSVPVQQHIFFNSASFLLTLLTYLKRNVYVKHVTGCGGLTTQLPR